MSTSDLTTLIKCAELCNAAYDGIKVGDHSYIVDATPNRTVIAIAGTKNIENFFEDLSCWPSWTPTGSLAHAGVTNAFNELEKDIANQVVKNGPVVFAGHSLGGGIAQIFAEKYNCEVVTFGSLKTYWRFYPAPKLHHTRVVCDDDPVPWLPGMTYAHRCEALTLKDADCELVNVKDHFIDTYIKRLEKGGFK